MLYYLEGSSILPEDDKTVKVTTQASDIAADTNESNGEIENDLVQADKSTTNTQFNTNSPPTESEDIKPTELSGPKTPGTPQSGNDDNCTEEEGKSLTVNQSPLSDDGEIESDGEVMTPPRSHDHGVKKDNSGQASKCDAADGNGYVKLQAFSGMVMNMVNHLCFQLTDRIFLYQFFKKILITSI